MEDEDFRLRRLHPRRRCQSPYPQACPQHVLLAGVIPKIPDCVHPARVEQTLAIEQQRCTVFLLGHV